MVRVGISKIKSYILLMILVISSILPVYFVKIPSVYANPDYSFSSGWESGDDEWDSNSTDDATMEIVQKEPFEGANHLEVNATHETGWSDHAYFTENIFSGDNTLYIGMDVYMNNSPPDEKYAMFYRWSRPADFYYAELKLNKRNATHYYWSITASGDTYESVNFTMTFTDDYFWLEGAIGNVGRDDGYVALWANGTKYIDVTGLDFLADNLNISVFSAGLVYSTSWGEHDVKYRFDNLVASSSGPIGPPMEGITLDGKWYNTNRAGDLFKTQVDISITGIGDIDELWLEHNNTGKLTNSSHIEIGGRSSTGSEVELTLNSTVGIVVQFRWIANTSDGVEYATGIFTLTTTTTPPEPSLYTSGTSVYNSETDSVVILLGASLRDFVIYESGVWPLIGTVNYDQGNWNATNVDLHLDAIKMWNINATRALFAVDDWQANTDNIWENLLYVANETRIRDMYLIVEPYLVNSSGSIPQMPYAPYNDPDHNEDVILPDRAAFVDLWENITLTFINEPNVIFAVWNEPWGPASEWLGTYYTLGGGEEAAIKIREYSDNIITLQSGYGIDNDVNLDWTDRIRFNCSYNFMVATHTYRNGNDDWWAADYATLSTEMTNIGMFSQTVPILLEEFAINDAVGDLPEETMWFNNVMTLLDEHGIGYMVWGWHGYGNYGILNYTQATVLHKWGWVPESLPYYHEFMARLTTRPRVWSIGNETLNGYDYPYSNNTDWSEDWNGTCLSVTIPLGNGAFTVRTLWNFSDAYPINSSAEILLSNGTLLNMIDYYVPSRNLVEIDYQCQSDVWVAMGYDLSEQGGGGFSSKINKITNAFSINGINTINISYINNVP